MPFGILEKHGPHLPLGTDLLDVRYVALNAAQQEYAVVFPEYYFGQIFEARHEPGTVAYSAHLQLELLQETTDEMARNGCKKIIIVNGHGGNEQPAALLCPEPAGKAARLRGLCAMGTVGTPAGGPAKKTCGRHARGRIRNLEDADFESGSGASSIAPIRNQAPTKPGLSLPDTLYTGIWWYARFPNHYSGDGAAATQRARRVRNESLAGRDCDRDPRGEGR